jgi:hypothetical protein
MMSSSASNPDAETRWSVQKAGDEWHPPFISFLFQPFRHEEIQIAFDDAQSYERSTTQILLGPLIFW